MTRAITYGEAIREGMAELMAADDRVYVLGEDVGAYGGVFGITKGLMERFGEERVRSTPLSENGILGEAIGAALAGLRPIAEIQFSDFITPAMSPLVDLAATYHWRLGTSVPIVVRMPSGGGLRAGNFHSKSLEAWFFHTPGLKIVVPSTPADAKGLLVSSLRDSDPVLFMEHKKLYYEISGDVPVGLYEVPLGEASIVRPGNQITLVTYGAMVHLALKAAKALEGEGIDLEVIDLRTLAPLDEETLLKSFRKTGRLIVLHEAPLRGGVGGELASLVCEKAFDSLAAPPIRIGAAFTPIPVPPDLEDASLPSVEQVPAAARRLAQY